MVSLTNMFISVVTLSTFASKLYINKLDRFLNLTTVHGPYSQHFIFFVTYEWTYKKRLVVHNKLKSLLKIILYNT